MMTLPDKPTADELDAMEAEELCREDAEADAREFEESMRMRYRRWRQMDEAEIRY